jgi:hypothetical protein
MSTSTTGREGVVVRVREIAEQRRLAELGAAISALAEATERRRWAEARCLQHPAQRPGPVAGAAIATSGLSVLALLDQAAEAADDAAQRALDVEAARAIAASARADRRAAERFAARRREAVELDAARAAGRSVDEYVSARHARAS